MDLKDQLIIAYLRSNGRIQLTDLSRKTGIPVSTLFDRIKGSNAIMRPTILLDFSKIGFATRATVMLRVDRADKEALRDYLQKTDAVNALCKINNGFDFLFEGIFRQVSDAEEFIERLEGKFRILDKQTYYIVEDLKREGFLADPQLVPK